MSVNIEGVLEVFKLQDTLNVYELIFIAIEMAKEVIITPDLKRFFHPLKVPQHTCSSLVGISEQLLLYAMKCAGVNLGALPLECETRSLIQTLNMDTSAQ